MEAKELTELRDELQKAYTPIISLEQWMFGESPCSKMISDMIKERDKVAIENDIYEFLKEKFKGRKILEITADEIAVAIGSYFRSRP